MPVHRCRPALLLGILLLAPAAQALELLDLQPGTPRAEAGRLLSQQFPPAEQLQARLPAGQHPDAVQPFDPEGCSGQPLCTASWTALDTQQQVRRTEAVQVAIRHEAVMGLRQQSWQQVGESCAAVLQQLRAGWQADWGAPVREQPVQYTRGQYLQQEWGECPAEGSEAPPVSGSCLRAESGCNGGELESEVSLTDYARLRP